MTIQASHPYKKRASYGCCAMTDAACLPNPHFSFLVSGSNALCKPRSTKEKETHNF